MRSNKALKPLDLYTLRVDSDKIATLKSIGIDINEAIREHLDYMLMAKVCPVCNQKLSNQTKRGKK